MGDSRAHHVSWMRDAVSIVFLTVQRRGVGTTFECLTRIGPFRTRDVMEITCWNETVAMGVVHRGVIVGRGEFSLTPTGAGTTLTWREELVFPWWMGGPVTAAATRPVLRRLWARNLAAFARFAP